jgi:hypothetical protein
MFFSFQKKRKKIREWMSIAICCMTMRVDANLDVWIHHHLQTVGIDYIFLRVEGSNAITGPHQQRRFGPRVLVLENEVVEDAHIDSVRRQQERQKRFVDQCLRIHAPRLRVRYLLHIDDDELLVLHKRWSCLKSLLQQRQQQLSPTTLALDSFRIQNYEAVLLSPPSQPSTQTTSGSGSNSNNLFFLTKHFKDGAMEECRGYRNGKSIALVGKTQECTGPHTFAGPWIRIDSNDAIILHYDSLTFEGWLKKFTHLSQCSPDILQHQLAPFPFYQKSILRIQQKEPHSVLYEFWRRWITRASNPIDISKDYTLLLPSVYTNSISNRLILCTT